jgi:hypothetical protein
MTKEEFTGELADDLLEDEHLAPLMPSNDVLHAAYRAQSDAALNLCRECGVETP